MGAKSKVSFVAVFTSEWTHKKNAPKSRRAFQRHFSCVTYADFDHGIEGKVNVR